MTIHILPHKKLLTKDSSLLNKTPLGNNHIDINTENKPFIGIPYVEGLSEKISGILHSYNYIGQTKRFLKNRFKEHKNNIRESRNKQNALTKHTIGKDHFFDYERTKILANEHFLSPK